MCLGGVAQAQTVNYGYDAQGRLVSAATVGGQTTTYSYDANGNRTQKVVGSGGGGGNTPPVANDDYYDLEIGPGMTGWFYPSALYDVLLNDTDADGDPLTITSITPTVDATATISANMVNYRHAHRYYADGHTADLIGMDTFTYTISDGRGGTATGSVTVNIVVW